MTLPSDTSLHVGFIGNATVLLRYQGLTMVASLEVV